MRFRRREGSDLRPFVLFLGTECARVARVDPESVAKSLRPVLDELPDRLRIESSHESPQGPAAVSTGEPA